MGRTRNLWVGLACGAALGIGAIAALDASTQTAGAQSDFKVTPAQLQINQKISQAAVRRSNEALGLLSPVRPQDSTDKKPVNPFASIARGSGWPTSALADGAVTSSKLDPALRTQIQTPGPTGPQGPQGPPGPSSGNGRQVPNFNDIQCDTDVVVGVLPAPVAQTSRVWVHGHGTMRKQLSNATAFTLRLVLRDSSGEVVATSIPALDSSVYPGDTDNIYQLTTGGILQSGDAPDTPAPPYEASPGSYSLQLVARAGEGQACDPGQLPSFGFNQYGNMSYMLVGAGG